MVLFSCKILYEAAYTMFNIPMGSLLSALFILGSWAAFKYVWNITPETRAKIAAWKQGE